jgi:hypothetical protein
VGATGAAIAGLLTVSPALVAVAVLIVSTASFLYFRLLGRLAWWLAESTPVETADDDQEK